MKNETLKFSVPSESDVTGGTKIIFEKLKKGNGMLPNIFATIGYSENALSSYLEFLQAQAKGSFHLKEREAIFLIVSQLNECDYCLAAHTLSAIRNGWTEEETIALRSGKLSDVKWQIIFELIKNIIYKKGEVGKTTLDSFFSLGYSETALIDLLALINAIIFTNYVYRLTKIPVDFAPAKPVKNRN